MAEAAADDYEYRGMVASAWDLLRGDYSTWPDRPFYRDVIRESGEPALDVGCGTGRLTLDYLSDGIDVDGVDVSPEMLDICREKAAALGLRPTLYTQQMESLDLPRKYRTIFVPSSSFQLLTDETAARAAMGRFRRHLEPGGTLVMSFMLVRPEKAPPDGVISEWFKTGERERPEDGALIRRWQRAWYDSVRRLEHSETRYEVFVDGEVVATETHRRSPDVRWYTQDQSRALYEECGFESVHAVSGFTRDVASAADRVWCVFGRMDGH